MRIHDISVELGPNTVPWPGMDPVAEQRVFVDIARGDAVTGSSWNLNSHVGTHIDAPLHLFVDGRDIAETSLDLYMGPALVVDLPELDRDIERGDLEAVPALCQHERVLFKTTNSRRLADLDRFSKDYVAVGTSAAALLAELDYKLVGVDYQGVERFDTTDYTTHRTLLDAGCAILEGAYLRDIEPGEYLLVCFPLRLAKGEASPVRAVLVQGAL